MSAKKDWREVGTLGLTGYCICGGSCKVSSNPPAHARGIMDAFRAVHDGEGHGPCDRQTAAAARRRASNAKPSAEDPSIQEPNPR